MREFRAGGNALPEDGGRQALNVAGAVRTARGFNTSIRGTPVGDRPRSGTSKWSLAPCRELGPEVAATRRTQTEHVVPGRDHVAHATGSRRAHN